MFCQLIVDVRIAKIHTLMIMRDVASKVNHDQLNKKKTFESIAETQRQQS